MKDRPRLHVSGWFVVVVNIACIVALVLAFILINAGYTQRMRTQNLQNVADLNHASATIAQRVFSNRQKTLSNIAQYSASQQFTVQQLLAYIEDSSADNSEEYQLIAPDYTGFYVSSGSHDGLVPVTYENSSYADLQKIFDAPDTSSGYEVRFMPEFTDDRTAIKSFALYTPIAVKTEEGDTQWYTLMALTPSTGMMDTLQMPGEYASLVSVIFDTNGSYIIGRPEFKGDNFYKYLYLYNDLSLDEQTALAKVVSGSDVGELFYKDSHGKDCVYSYIHMEDSGWFCVSCVPLDELTGTTFDYTLTLVCLLILFVMFVSDLLWLNSLNHRLRQSVAHEREANDAKTDFLSRMSHDIRTPLNGIIGMTVLSQEEDSLPVIKDYLGKIDSSSHFLLGLVNDILDMNKVESGKMELHPEPYYVRTLQEYLEAVIRPLCSAKGVHFVLETPQDPQPIMLDRLRFNQVVFNLLSNAVKFTPQDGTVRLSVRTANMPENQKDIIIEVADTGVGMSEEFQQHMFEPFSQEMSGEGARQQGTGLGLAIVSNLVKLMGGTVTVQSAPGKGACFTVHLTAPVADASLLQSAQGAAAADVTRIAHKRILLCEDHPLNAQIARTLLEKRGALVELAENGQIGVDSFTASQPGYYNLILMDVRMPIMDGITATKAIRALPREDAAEIPIIAMTANAFEEDVEQCTAAGMNAHLAKPIEADKFFAVLAAHLPADAAQSGTSQNAAPQ